MSLGYAASPNGGVGQRRARFESLLGPKCTPDSQSQGYIEGYRKTAVFWATDPFVPLSGPNLNRTTTTGEWAVPTAPRHNLKKLDFDQSKAA